MVKFLSFAIGLFAAISFGTTKISEHSAASTKADLADPTSAPAIKAGGTYEKSVIDPLRKHLDEMDGKGAGKKETAATNTNTRDEVGLRMSHLGTVKLGGRGPSN